MGVAYAKLVAAQRIPSCRYMVQAAKRFLRMYEEAHSGSAGFYWCDASAIEPCAFIERLPHVKGDLAGRSLVLEPWQMWVVIAIYGFRMVSANPRENGARLVRTAMLEVPRKNGKAEWIENLIPTTDGMRRMADIEVGDVVFAPDGSPTPVVAVSPVWINRPCMEVEFSTGERIIVDEEHEWETKRRHKGDKGLNKRLPRSTWYNKATDHSVSTTKEISETLTYGGRGDRNHFIEVASAAQTEPREYIIDPYVLGAWLGDGCKYNSTITIAEPEIVEAIAACGETIQARPQASSLYLHILGGNGRFKEFRYDSMQARLRRLGLLMNKHIPEDYLLGSINQRYALLQGLMDTDGSASLTGPNAVPRCEFTTTSEQLRDGMMRLLGSLGIKATSKEGRSKLNGRDCGPKWRICFTAFQDQPIFRLTRKQERLSPRPERPTRSSTRAIVAVRDAGRRATKCIQVAHPSHQYLTGRSFIPTHNSFLTAGLSLYELCVNANYGDDLFIIAPTAAQAQKVLEPMREMVKLQPVLESHFGITATREKLTVGETNSYALVLASQGKSQDGHDPKIIVADEFHSVPADIFKVMKSSQGARPESLFIQIGTAGYDAFGPGWDQRQEAIRVLEGDLRRDRLFAAIWTIDNEDRQNLDRESIIRKANPCYGVSLVESAVAEEMLDLHGRDPVKKAELLRTRFNIWGLGEQKLIPREAWLECRDEDLDLEDFAGERAWIGLDLATRNDMVAWVIEFVQNGKIYCFARHYVPEHGPWRDDQDVRDYYEQWHEEGFIEFTPGSHHSYTELEADIRADSLVFDILAVMPNLDGMDDVMVQANLNPLRYGDLDPNVPQ